MRAGRLQRAPYRPRPAAWIRSSIPDAVPFPPLDSQMFCWDESSCNMRYATHDYYMSSIKKPWSYDFAQGGIFATDGSSPWGTANRVYVKYCSSDLWSGDVGASAATFGFEFRGSRVCALTLVIMDAYLARWRCQLG